MRPLRCCGPSPTSEAGENEASGGIPVREMLGDMLLEANRPEEALVEYEASLQE